VLQGQDEFANYVVGMPGSGRGTEDLVEAFLAMRSNETIDFTVE
jgi:hypothetical protein